MFFFIEFYYYRGKKSVLKFSFDKFIMIWSYKYVNYIWKYVRFSYGYLYYVRIFLVNKNLYFWVLFSINDNFFIR